MSQKTTKIKFEIRRNFRTGHPAVVYTKNGHRYKFLGLTHAQITKHGKNNKRLIVNPDPNDRRVAYFLTYSQYDHKRDFGPKLVDWKISKQDQEVMIRYMK